MGCPPVRGDNPRALASGLSYVQVDKHGLTILYHLHQCRPCTSRIFHANVCKGGMSLPVVFRPIQKSCSILNKAVLLAYSTNIETAILM